MSYRKTITIFLGSPGDVGPERDAVQATVEEMNRLIAYPLGYHLELFRWEDASPGMGRPQARLNRGLERCDLFIGMLYRKWGTPPDVNGPYTSGFEEEFCLSVERQAKSGSPDIWLMFKTVPLEFLQDPGEDLKKVLAFQQARIAEKALMYSQFADVVDLQTRLRSYIAAYLHNLADADRDVRADLGGRQLEIEAVTEPKGQRPDAVLSYSSEAVDFLRTVAEGRDDRPDGEMTNGTVARLRLIGLIRSSPGNDAEALGVHDSNLLYEARGSQQFGDDEIDGLVVAGLHRIRSQYAPVWHWLPRDVGAIANALALGTVIHPTPAARAGALQLMTMTGALLDHPTDGISRTSYRDHWFGNPQETEVHTAALRYFARWGEDEDIDALITLYGRGTPRAQDVVKAAIELASRLDRQRALSLILDLQPTDLPEAVVARALEVIGTLQPGALIEASGASLPAVRIAAAQTLHTLSQGARESLIILRDDESPKVRLAAILALEALGETLSLGAVESILVRRQRRPSIFGIPGMEGQAEYAAYKAKRLPHRSAEALGALVEDGATDAAILTAYCEVACGLDALREILDRVAVPKRVADQIGSKRTAEVSLATLLSTATDRLAAARQSVDLERIRSVITDSPIRLNEGLAAYIGAQGDWSDVARLAATALNRPGGSRNALLIPESRHDEYAWTAQAMLRLGKGHHSQLLKTQMPAEVLARVVHGLARTTFKGLSDRDIEGLLTHGDDAVRKVACLRIARDLPAKRADTLLNAFMVRSDGRYYDVVHWLDFAVSAPRVIVARTATNLLDDLEALLRN